MKHYIFFRMWWSNDCSWGGCENQILDYFSGVDYSVNRITLITSDSIFTPKFKERGLPVNVIQCLPSDFGRHFWQRLKRMFLLLKPLRPDGIVYVQGRFPNFKLSDFLIGFFVTKGNIYALEVGDAPALIIKKSKRYLGIVRGLGLWWYKWWFESVLPATLKSWLCKSILTVSDEIKEQLVKLYKYPRKKIVTIFHGVDTKIFSTDLEIRNRMRKHFDIPEKDVVIVSTARLIEEKCIDKLINAFNRVSKNYRNCWLFILGDGPEMDKLKKLAESKESHERIKFLGFKNDISDYLKMSDIYVLPSDAEGLGIALLEAMATELISIATKTSGPNEVIKDGINGFLVERSEDGVLCGLKKTLALTNEQKKQMLKNARTCVLEKFDLTLRVKNALKILGLASAKEHKNEIKFTSEKNPTIEAMPKISVIIPTYNRAHIICEAIDSVLAQTYKDYEIIVADDGSTDNTKEILTKYGNKIRCFTQENKGVSAARNMGIREAQGKWIAFLDSDDIWLSNKLELQINIIETYPEIQAISTDAELFDGTGIRRPSLMHPGKIPSKENLRYSICQKEVNDESIFTYDNIYEQLLLSGSFFILPTMLIRKDCLLRVCCFNAELTFAEDYELCLRIAQNYPMLYFNKITTKCRIAEGGLSGDFEMRPYRYKKWNGRMFEIHLKDCPKKYRKFIKKIIIENYRSAIWGYLNDNDLTEVKKLCYRSLSFNALQLKLYFYLLVSFAPIEVVTYIQEKKLQLCRK